LNPYILHLLKKTLGVNYKVCNSACRSELNRWRMKTKIQLSIIKFWEHIVNSYNTLIHKIYLTTDQNNAAIFLWLSQAMTGFLMYHIVVLFYGSCFINFINLRLKTTCVPASVLYTYAPHTNINNSTTLQAAIMYTVFDNNL
jgi:hypothetical protein